ncbi:MAG: RsiV family protein [Spirochaetaceae bacterium]|jgi:hypothetical protein|nr:RsiV family protein [Spirochaetaceae bacterium]
MKISFIVVLFAAFAAVSCTGLKDKGETSNLMNPVYGKGWYAADVLPSRYITYSKSEIVPFFPKEKGKGPKLEFSVDTLDILAGGEHELLQKTLYGGLSCRDYAAKLFDKVNGEYQKAKDGVIGQPGAVYEWSYIETFGGEVFPSLLVISRHWYSYTGGANGQSEKTFFVLDTGLLSKVALNDILQKGVEEKLQTQIDDALRARHHAAPGTPLTSIGFLKDTGGVPQNFFVSREGLGFCWNPYEIAPHSYGILEIVLPYAQIEALLNDRGKEIFKKL